MTGADGGTAADVKAGAYAHFSRLDFGTGRVVSLRLKTSAAAGVSGTLSVHLGTKAGPNVGATAIDRQRVLDRVRDLALGTASGTHDLWFVADTGNQVFAQVDYVLRR
jgi:hypothetical protein